MGPIVSKPVSNDCVTEIRKRFRESDQTFSSFRAAGPNMLVCSNRVNTQVDNVVVTDHNIVPEKAMFSLFLSFCLWGKGVETPLTTYWSRKISKSRMEDHCRYTS